MNWKKSVILKKVVRHGFNLLRPIVSKTAKGPIVLANSFPKSGTHLLTQILSAFSVKDYGNFLASTPSLTMREVSQETMCHRVNKLIGGELASAHLFYDQQVASNLSKKNVTHYFIYRDPRDVIVSECYYLSEMNRFHKLHEFFNKFEDTSSKISASISGVSTEKFYYPDIGTRMSRYTAWINNDSVLAVRFEDLVGEKQAQTVYRIVEHYYQNNNLPFDDFELMTTNAISSIAPEKSHTFRSGKVGKWQEYFNEEQIKQFNRLAGEEMALWGYE